ncbi:MULTISPECIES: MFS transporter [Vibrio]|uniref:MFS transporter n=1 Tax=Vibrio TaxID=662 RepID=UPI00029A5569|nr:MULTISPECIES: MFS transporter [Vibrio]KAA8602583.1 putative MFS-type transporter [Vibrio cyclitrophicus]MBE8558109.1 MFS transporter [Vibrio sp. OPT24]MDH5878198.1 MFS transporter [Vibrio sp. S/42/10]NOH42729.1 MFS transporter [Vibrio cyclitrophicus]OBT02491.1 MFS transporter [Vibrio cyclitrophicus]|tara:strand:- start:7369 stop:8538 length:1170 start_codon:yes stop_codon:yes gene_type:complete
MSKVTTETLGTGRLLLMSSAVSATAANLYYNQPILPKIGTELGLTSAQLGAVPAASQIGYAVALLFLSPLGDTLPRKRLIAILSVMLVLSSFIAFSASSLIVLVVACFAIGLSANITQQLIPFAASLSTPETKGKVIGTLMTGLTVGILLSRTLSGFVGEQFGWRAVFMMSASIAMIFGLMLYAFLPTNTPTIKIPYLKLVASMATLIKQHSILRTSALTGALWFASFNALWATLALHVSESPFNYNAQQAGMFGVIAFAGVIGAKVSGSLVGKFGSRNMISMALVIIAAGFVVSGLFADTLIGLIAGIILIDLGVFSAQVSNQVRVFSIDPQAQSRINGVYMLGYYLGGAFGSFVGIQVFELVGWVGVVGFSVAAVALSFIVNRINKQ